MMAVRLAGHVIAYPILGEKMDVELDQEQGKTLTCYNKHILLSDWLQQMLTD